MTMSFKTRSRVNMGQKGKWRRVGTRAGRGCKLVRLGTFKQLDKRGAERTIIHCTYVNKGRDYHGRI